MKPSSILFEAFDQFIGDPLNGIIAGSAFLLFVLIRASILQWSEYQSLYRSFWVGLLGGLFSWLSVGILLWLKIELQAIMVLQALSLLGIGLGIDLLFTLILKGKAGDLAGGVLGTLLGYIILSSICLFIYVAFAYPSSSLWMAL